MDAEAVVRSWALASMFLSVKWKSEKGLPHSLLGGSDHVLHQCLQLVTRLRPFHHILSHTLSLGLILETDQRVWTHLHKTPASL